jgi:hypothetical protein
MEDNTKVPQAELNYTIDWTEWLNGDTIAASSWVLPDGLVKLADSVDSGQKTIVKIKGGTVGRTYTVINRITTTTSGEKDERSFQIQIVARKEE